MYDFVFLESSFSASKWERKALERDYAYRLQYRSLHNPCNTVNFLICLSIHSHCTKINFHIWKIITDKKNTIPSLHIYHIGVGGGQGHHCTKINFHIWKVITEFDARNM